ncbi:BadF/BadG/BcrA/BcrD ATPase family protein [Metallosphaera hakonensis]|uniref:BadF/BadG/BcrA/BcrD ATPase family protein n=1 Tax=Metallosphaera hakonensis TaxID=79601 RepID=UPI00209202B8|nr:BadF/BadG/BcrA/BcrD ATPase family protein [Metallosphaera hakonensis]
MAGTGNVAYIQKSGQMRRLAGWGWFFGDEGSASYIGRKALTMATRAVDGLVESRLPEEVESFFGKPLREVIERFTRRPNKRAIASFARIVDGLAERGDPASILIMNEVIEYLDSMLKRIKREVDRVAGTGGVFKSRLVRRKFPDLTVYESYQTVIGSVILLLENVTEEDRTQLLKQLDELRGKSRRGSKF